jgi:hypothetical protein
MTSRGCSEQTRKASVDTTVEDGQTTAEATHQSTVDEPHNNTARELEATSGFLDTSRSLAQFDSERRPPTTPELVLPATPPLLVALPSSDVQIVMPALIASSNGDINVERRETVAIHMANDTIGHGVSEDVIERSGECANEVSSSSKYEASSSLPLDNERHDVPYSAVVEQINGGCIHSTRLSCELDVDASASGDNCPEMPTDHRQPVTSPPMDTHDAIGVSSSTTSMTDDSSATESANNRPQDGVAGTASPQQSASRGDGEVVGSSQQNDVAQPEDQCGDVAEGNAVGADGTKRGNGRVVRFDDTANRVHVYRSASPDVTRGDSDSSDGENQMASSDS